MNNELSFIKLLRQTCKKPKINLSIGDDAACFDKFLITTDVLVENIHFTMRAGIKNIIFKLFTANVSDIAAMGGTPLYALLTASFPKNSVLHAELVNAINESLHYYGIYLIGGDTTSSVNTIFFSLTLIGKKNKHVLKRSTAKPGDLLCLSRPTGLTLLALERELNNKDIPIEIFYHYNISAEKELGILLGTLDGATACIDISDGLGVDANHLSEESHVKAIIEMDKLPIDHLKKFNVDEKYYVLHSGEEFALLFTIDKNEYNTLYTNIEKHLGRHIYLIGHIQEGSGVFLKDGEHFIDISHCGYIHDI